MKNEIDLSKANLDNLTTLWKHMGASPSPSCADLMFSDSWHHRAWLDVDSYTPSPSVPNEVIRDLEARTVVPVWGNTGEIGDTLAEQLETLGYSVLFEQIAMSLAMKKDIAPVQDNVMIREVESDDDITLWTHIAATSFGYAIDQGVIEAVTGHPDVRLITAFTKGNKAAGCAMIFRTGDVEGVHQLGVLPDSRGLGIARALMNYILMNSRQSGAKFLCLQASVMGKALYASLGFEEQFVIRNYRRAS